MKYVFAAVAVVAAIIALYVRPPHLTGGSPADVAPPPSAGGNAARPNANRVPPLRTAQLVVIYVAGAVRKPGVYRLASSGRAVDALARAGGALPEADLVAVNLAAPLSDGAEIAVPKLGDRPAHVLHARVAHALRGHRRRRPVRPTAGVSPDPSAVTSIDLNAASPAELQEVPGIGPGLAARIIAYRESNGPFANIDELADVAGITPRLQDALAATVVIR